jgi:hypothetical protein
MTSPIQLAGAQCMTSTVIALHCSLGSGRQWAHLAETLGQSHRILAPDIAGYGNDPGPFARCRRRQPRPRMKRSQNAENRPS